MTESDEPKLLLYELDHREPIGYVDALGEIRHMDFRAATIKYDLSTGRKSGVPSWPKVIFADVSTILHLACGHTIAPMSEASAETGPIITPNDVIVDGEQRYYPAWCSTVVKQQELDEKVFISDIYGGHALWITREEWDALEPEASHDR